jgi:1-phosphatidylinositol-3-phosphate 5-kinase
MTMNLDASQDTPSPTASSIFLPLGRRSRRGSRASDSGPTDRETLNEALDNIHNAAYQSSSLTVFNEYTSPPNASSAVEKPGIAEELQGSLSGLYSKFKASVGGAKDLIASPNKTSDGLVSHDDGSSNRSVGQRTPSPLTKPASKSPQVPQTFRVIDGDGDNVTNSSRQQSRLHSPVVAYFEVPQRDVHTALSKESSKAASVISRASIPPTPALRSPTGQIHKEVPSLVVDPTLADSKLNAVREISSQVQPPTNGGHGSHDSYGLDRLSQHVSHIHDPDESALKRTRSAEASSLPQHSLASPHIAQTPPKQDQKESLRVSHEREGPMNSTTAITNQLPSRHQISSLSPDTVSTSSFAATSEPSTNAFQKDSGIGSRGQDLPGASLQRRTDPLKLLDEDPTLDLVTSPAAKSGVKSPKSPVTPSARPSEKLPPRISSSRLPGFGLPRASSSISTITSRGVSQNRAQGGLLDGMTEADRSVQQPPKIVINKLRSKLLSKEFWMRDENAKDCFHCGEPFSTFRRKHHCRTCGQIFDNKCTVLIEGSQFGSTSSVRVCKPCEAIINAHEDDSSEYSVEDLSISSPTALRPHTPIAQQILKSTLLPDDDSASIISQSLEHVRKTPTMSFPVRRAVDSSNRRSAVLEFDANDRSLARPSSSRSLKSSHSIGHGHKRHYSRHQHIRNFKAYHEERAPFQRRMVDDIPRDAQQSAFHHDNIIDPDLAQYLSDDASSDDDHANILAVSEEKLSRSVPESDKASFGGLLAAVRKGRSRFAERSVASLLNSGCGDDASIVSSRGNPSRPVRKRNLSAASSTHVRLSPNPSKEDSNYDSPSTRAQNGSRMTRSASMRGAGAPPVELNQASLQHVRKILQQLLNDANVPRASSWETALVPILLKATDTVDPDVQRGDDIDIRHYVKLKKIPGGKPGDTSYISGLVFTKNLALKSMSRSIQRPSILIITFALEYARHQQHFMSLEPVIRQEREYLANLVSRIAAQKPQLLLVQRNVSGMALELLEKASIATAYNVKPTVLEAVSRCTQTRIIHSMDKLAMQPGQTGVCESFDVKTYVFGGKKKTYMHLSGCPPQLGCTITLRGAESNILSKIKRITEFMVYVVYNLKLETSLMRDEFALIPSGSANATTSPRKIEASNETAQKPSNTLNAVNERLHAQTVAKDVKVSATDKQPATSISAAIATESAETAEIPDDIPVPTFYEDLVEKHQTKILSASPFVKFMQPYLLMRARELERRVAYLKRLRDQDLSADQSAEDKAKAQKFTLIQPEMVHTSLVGAGAKVREILHAVHDTEYDKALHNYETQKRQWESYLSGNRNLFDPYAHQNIVVLFSQVSTATSVPCSGPDVLAFGFYNEHETDEQFEPDCTLGQYVEDLCYRADDVCQSRSCEKRMYDHHRQYVHGEAQVSVFVQPYPAKMRGMQDTILMWSQCKICGNETPTIPMSANSWKYSFGKYLELSFWSADLHARAGLCPHDLHRDHLRYFGYKDFALRIHYDAISLLEVIVPRMRITWKVDNDLKFRNEVYVKTERRLNRFMVSVKSRLKGINSEAVLPEKAEACRQEVERLTKRANEEHVTLVKHLQDKYSNSRHWETIPLNQSIRSMQEKVAEWDNAFTEFERDFFPSEKDIRRLATLQLKKIFLDRDVSVTSLASTDDGVSTPRSETSFEEKREDAESASQPTRPRRLTHLSPEKTHSVLQAVVEQNASGLPESLDSSQDSLAKTESKAEQQYPPELQNSPHQTNSEDIRHLDLAVPSGLPDHVVSMDLSPPHGGIDCKSSDPTDPKEDGEPFETTSGTHSSASSNDVPTEKQTFLPPTNPGPDAPSHIPRAVEALARIDGGGRPNVPPLLRAHSQPAGSLLPATEKSGVENGTLLAIHATQGFGSKFINKEDKSLSGNEPMGKATEKKLPERFGLSHLKGTKLTKGHSLIPRSVALRKDSRVSNLAKHFEQLSREFEKERIRERKQRAARTRNSRIYPLASSRPIVEVYKSVDDAVESKDATEESFMSNDPHLNEQAEASGSASELAEAVHSPKSENSTTHGEDTATETNETETDTHDTSRAPSDGEEDNSDGDQNLNDIQIPESPEDLAKLSPEDLDLKELPKHERTSLMKMLTNFWAERSSSGWTPLDYPLTAADHVFADCNIIVREDEPSSVIAFALDSEDYKSKLMDIQEHRDGLKELDGPGGVKGEEGQANVMHSLLRKTGTHLKYQFQEGPAKMLCKIFFAEQFDAVRRKCGVSDRIVESLSRCMKWDSKGGKTKSLFLKTLDDRFVLKSLSPIETQAFLKFAPNYFQIMSEAFFHELPSVIAKMLGFYQIIIKNSVTGVECNWFLLVMENLFYDRVPTRIFDLKGSMRNRRIQSTGERNEVLLDENMVEFIYESPLFAREHSKKLLKTSVYNDTLFLAKQNVMDYSLMVAIDESRKELVVGIIDCIRTYTWDKKLESWIKDRGFAGGGKNRPTVTSPREYKKRFREAMGRYVLEAPK